jgi:hypothetical protein
LASDAAQCGTSHPHPRPAGRACCCYKRGTTWGAPRQGNLSRNS